MPHAAKDSRKCGPALEDRRLVLDRPCVLPSAHKVAWSQLGPRGSLRWLGRLKLLRHDQVNVLELMIQQDTPSFTRRPIVISPSNPLRISPSRSRRHSLALSFTAHSCFPRFYHFLVNMFKSLGGSGPKTPKLSSVSLPNEGGENTKHFKFPGKLFRGSISDPIGRSMTPGPPCRAGVESSTNSRTRATSLQGRISRRIHRTLIDSTRGQTTERVVEGSSGVETLLVVLSFGPVTRLTSTLAHKPTVRGGASNLERTENYGGKEWFKI